MTSLSTKRAFITSVISLLTCITMLIGSTFAWFTDNDSIKSGNITAGTLDIEIVDATGAKKTTALAFLDKNGATPAFWEPGATYHTEQFAIKNNGNLNLKFKLDIKGAKISEGKLNEVISFTLVNAADETKTYTIANNGENNTVLMSDIPLAAGATSDFYYIKAVMDPNAGNDYQELKLDGLNIVVYATQAEGEFDINGDDYDKDATYDGEVVLVKNADEFLAAFAALEADQIINLTNDIDLTGKSWTPVANKGFTLNGNGKTITGMNGALVSTTAALNYTIKNVTFKNLTINAAYGAGNDFAGAAGLIGYADTCAYIMMDNVTIDGANIGGAEYVGGFAGYTSGYGDDTNGPVNASHNFINCTIKNSTLKSSVDGSVGGLIGHAGSNPATTTRVTDFTYDNIALEQQTARTDKLGYMIGTCNVGTVYIVDTGANVANDGATISDIGRFVTAADDKNPSIIYGKLYVNGFDTPAFDGK